MSGLSSDEILQFTAWFITLIELLVGVYILFLNPRHSANRHVGITLVLISINTYAVAVLLGTHTVSEAKPAAIFLAITSLSIQPLLLLTTVALLKLEWLQGRLRFLWWPVYLLAALPLLLTLSDLLLKTRFLYSGIDPSTYPGGFLILSRFTGGLIVPILRTVSFGVINVATIGLLFFLAFFDKDSNPAHKKLARILLISMLVASIPLLGFTGVISDAGSVLISGTVFAMAYGYAGFQQLISERKLQRGSLQRRLTLVTLMITIPILVAIVMFITRNAEMQLEQSALTNLHTTNQALNSTVSVWIESNVKTLQDLAAHPDMVSLDPARQEKLLKTMSASRPWMNLVSTTDLKGQNIARSDNEPAKDNSDREWFLQARGGTLVAYQTLFGETSKRPALVVAVPIHNPMGDVIGVSMFASDLDAVSSGVQANKVGQKGFSYIIDAENKVIAHPDKNLTAKLQDLSEYPPVMALRQGIEGAFNFTDQDGLNWRAELSSLANGWGIIVQLPEAEFFTSSTYLQRLSWLALLIGCGMLLTFSWLTTRQSIQPIQSLTETVKAISAGDLSRKAPVESQDEIGLLGASFNDMTSQLRDLITGLERRVEERTQALQKRAIQSQVTALVAREAAGAASAFRDLEPFLEHTVHLITDRFGYYHTGIFMIDETGEYAVLRAASSEGGRNMLARNHKLKVGQVGIVGYVASSGEPRIALDVGMDAVFFNNPDLPQTRSEMALPLTVKNTEKPEGKIIGILDVQSTQPGAFSEEDVMILQVLADQVALAIENARLFAESERAFTELNHLYRQQISQNWSQFARRKQQREQPSGYYYDLTGIKPTNNHRDKSLLESDSQTQPDDPQVLKVPIELRGYALGSLTLRRQAGQGAWSTEEKETVRDIVNQIALALENARLLEEVQRRIRQEQWISSLSRELQSSLDLEKVMKTAVQEIGRSLDLSKVQIRLVKDQG